MFESEIDSHEAFVFSVNRALVEIHSEKERLEELKIYKRRCVTNEYIKMLVHEVGKFEKLTLNGKAFSLTAVGTGSVFLDNGLSDENISFSGTATKIARKINAGRATLSFAGDFTYTVYDIASFDEIYSENEDDIPLYESRAKYDMRELDQRFLSFSGAVTDSEGGAIQGLKIDGSIVSVPPEYEGELIFHYRRMPIKITDGELDTVLDVSPECEHLLALKIASYMLLDGNEGLAEYYLSLYRSGIAHIKSSEGRRTGEKFHDVLGWT